MTTPVEPIPDERISVEIRKLMAQTVRLGEEQAEFDRARSRAYIQKLDLLRKRWWVPFALTFGCSALTAVILTLWGR